MGITDDPLGINNCDRPKPAIPPTAADTRRNELLFTESIRILETIHNRIHLFLNELDQQRIKR